MTPWTWLLVSPVTRPKPSSTLPPTFLAAPVTRCSSMVFSLLVLEFSSNAAQSIVAERALLLVGDPGRRILVVGKSGCALQLVLRRVHDEVPFVLIFGRYAHGVEGHGNILLASAEKPANADDERGHLAGLVDQNVHDLADLGVLRVIDALLVPVGHREGIGGNAALHGTFSESSGADDGNDGGCASKFQNERSPIEGVCVCLARLKPRRASTSTSAARNECSTRHTMSSVFASQARRGGT